MKYSDEVNYVVLANNVRSDFLSKFSEYQVMDNMGYRKLKQVIEEYNKKQIVVKEMFYGLKDEEKIVIKDLLRMRNIHFIDITANVEDTLDSDYIIVYDNLELVLEGNRDEVLKNEKLLKRLGYGLPFIVDLSLQLSYYDLVDKVYYDDLELVGDVWN